MASEVKSASSSEFTPLRFMEKNEIPSDFIRPANQRPTLEEISLLSETNECEYDSNESVVVVDLEDTNYDSKKGEILRGIRKACETDGFFQVINHGVMDQVMKETVMVTKEFFNLPWQCKQEFYSEDPNEPVRFSTSVNVGKETVKSWRQYLRFECRYLDKLPSKPSSLREIVGTYCKEMEGFIKRLLALISESLGLDEEHLLKKLGGDFDQHMSMNYYPRCPNPELTLGLPGHFDPTVITLVQQDNVAGLQVMRDGKWVTISPVKNSIVVNVGDQLQVMSNSIYKSGYHRVIVNSKNSRISIPTFCFPRLTTVIEAVEELLDDENPRRHRSFEFQEYYKGFWGNSLDKSPGLTPFLLHHNPFQK